MHPQHRTAGQPAQDLPVVALTLGDPAGIGPELIARLLARPEAGQLANVVLIGDPWLWEAGQRIAGVRVALDPVDSFAAARAARHRPRRLAGDGHGAARRRQPGQAGAAGGASVLRALDACMDAALAGHVDAICFAPLNKHAMKLGGLRHDDELHHFAQYLGVTGYFCEFNTLGDLWTSRVSSHIPLKDAAAALSVAGIKDAARLIHRALQASGVPEPRVAVAAFNPHGGDGGTCGREEVDIIAPAVRELNQEGLPVQGRFRPTPSS